MSGQSPDYPNIASPAQRVAAIESVLEERGMQPGRFVEQMTQLAEERWVPDNGARVVARAWTDPRFLQRLRANGRAAVAELGIDMPRHHRHLVVLENTPSVHTVICCTLLKRLSLRTTSTLLTMPTRFTGTKSLTGS